MHPDPKSSHLEVTYHFTHVLLAKASHTVIPKFKWEKHNSIIIRQTIDEQTLAPLPLLLFSGWSFLFQAETFPR